jgi:hypothetical protein
MKKLIAIILMAIIFAGIVYAKEKLELSPRDRQMFDGGVTYGISTALDYFQEHGKFPNVEWTKKEAYRQLKADYEKTNAAVRGRVVGDPLDGRGYRFIGGHYVSNLHLQ